MTFLFARQRALLLSNFFRRRAIDSIRRRQSPANQKWNPRPGFSRLRCHPSNSWGSNRLIETRNIFRSENYWFGREGTHFSSKVAESMLQRLERQTSFFIICKRKEQVGAKGQEIDEIGRKFFFYENACVLDDSHPCMKLDNSSRSEKHSCKLPEKAKST